MRHLYLILMRFLASWLSKPGKHVHYASPATDMTLLKQHLQPGDVLLVEGSNRISSAIEYLSQSSWSHAALYVGEEALSISRAKAGDCFIEADITDGIRSVGFDEFAGLPTRICRPVGLSTNERKSVCSYAITRLGDQYDLRNVIDLARYLFPTPPVPKAWRRRMLALGSGDPTRAICSTLIALAFQSVRYPILPVIDKDVSNSPDCPGCIREILHIRHHSLFVPRDFDASPYFRIIKPTLETNFDFHQLTWSGNK